MSSSNQITPISFKSFFDVNTETSSQSYNDLINYGSIRKQFSRLIPNYLNYQNKKYKLNHNSSSNIEELNKLKQEIISIKESISSLQEKKQRKLDQIEELRCLMRKVGNKQNNNKNDIIKQKNNFNIIPNYHQRETNDHKTNNQYFRGTNKKQHSDNIKSSSDEVEGGLSLMHSTSDMSSGKDDEAAPEGGYEGDAQGDFILCENSSSLWSNSSNRNCCGNKKDCSCCFVGEEDKGGKLKGLQEKDNCLLLQKGN